MQFTMWGMSRGGAAVLDLCQHTKNCKSVWNATIPALRNARLICLVFISYQIYGHYAIGEDKIQMQRRKRQERTSLHSCTHPCMQ
eukprot:scaffold25762_cov15-Tisochrysis_lutea.AAC.1